MATTVNQKLKDILAASITAAIGASVMGLILGYDAGEILTRIYFQTCGIIVYAVVFAPPSNPIQAWHWWFAWYPVKVSPSTWVFWVDISRMWDGKNYIYGKEASGFPNIRKRKK